MLLPHTGKLRLHRRPTYFLLLTFKIKRTALLWGNAIPNVVPVPGAVLPGSRRAAGVVGFSFEVLGVGSAQGKTWFLTWGSFCFVLFFNSEYM